MNREAPRLALSAAIVSYFGWAVFSHWSAGIEQTVTNLVMMVAGYWLGSSKGSADNATRADKAVDALADKVALSDGPTGEPDDPLSVVQGKKS